MLYAIKLGSKPLSAAAGRSPASFVCVFCQRYPLTTPIHLNLTLRYVSTETLKKPKVQASPELIREIRSEIEAHRASLKEKEKKQKEEKKEMQPKAPKVRPLYRPVRSRIPVDPTGRTLKEALTLKIEKTTINPDHVTLEPIPVPDQPPVAALSHDLDRVLFNPGVYFLQDPRSKVYNFDPYLQKLMPVNEFDFESLSEYITSSRDRRLEQLAKNMGKKYVGSTSSMTSILSHFHYLLSSWRPINPSVISQNFAVPWKTFTILQRSPQSVFLRWKNGVYAVDADKEFDKESVLTLLGKSMEKLLTLPPDLFEQYRKTNEPSKILKAPAVDTYHYSTLGDFLMRSQLDAHDPRLPGTGMFDLKTRAVVSIRMDVENFHIGSGYQIKDRFGEWESFEREYFDMIRAAFLKYSLQVRMGRMDGIFVAFHNTERIFGFQYISLEEMDAAIHQDWHSGIGDREFKLSLQILNDVFNRATEQFPKQSLRLFFETRETQTPLMYIFAEPMTEEMIDKIQETKKTDLTKFLRELSEKKTSYLASLDAAEKIVEAAAEAKTTAKKTSATESTTTTREDSPIIGELPTSPEEVIALSRSASESQGNPTTITPTTETVSESESTADGSTVDATEEVPELTTDTDSEPDTEWIMSMESELRPPTTPPVLAYTLKIKSYVNDKIVLRPNNLKPTDKWEVQYDLEEIKGPRAWTTYGSCKSRKCSFMLDRPGLAGEDSDLDGGVRDVYLRNIREISMRGREYVRKVEVEEERAKKIVWTSGSVGLVRKE